MSNLSRRAWLGAAAVGAAAATELLAEDRQPVLKGNLKHSLARWCFAKHWKTIDEMCLAAKKLGCTSIELVPVADWPTLIKHGLVCAIASSHGFEKGMNNPKYREMCLTRLREQIDAASAAGFPNVITFTGFREDIPDDVGLKNCLEGFKQIVGHAEKQKVTLCLEMLNSRVNAEMKGHPGYQGDHTDYCIEILKQVGSPRLKLLFDVYHVQIMDGDVIARIRQYAEYIGHVHTAGNPGRGELDDEQEINYRPIMKALVASGYRGHVGHEFIPTRDPFAGLQQAIAICDA